MSSRRPSLRLARILDRLDKRKRAARKAAAAGIAPASEQQPEPELLQEADDDKDRGPPQDT
jgi:hypothetical protein